MSPRLQVIFLSDLMMSHRSCSCSNQALTGMHTDEGSGKERVAEVASPANKGHWLAIQICASYGAVGRSTGLSAACACLAALCNPCKPALQSTLI